MTRTDLDAATLARSLRRMAGDGSIEWVMEPIQASVLHDVADMLDENATLRQQLADVTESMGRVEERCAKLREERDMYRDLVGMMDHPDLNAQLNVENAKLRELVRDVHALGWSGFDCTECPRSFCERCHEDGGCPWVFILTDRMRELGVD